MAPTTIKALELIGVVLPVEEKEEAEKEEMEEDGSKSEEDGSESEAEMEVEPKELVMLDSNPARDKAMKEKDFRQRQLDAAIKAELPEEMLEQLRKRAKEVVVPSAAECIKDASMKLSRLTLIHQKVGEEQLQQAAGEEKQLEAAVKRVQEANLKLQKLQERNDKNVAMRKLQMQAIELTMTELQDECALAARTHAAKGEPTKKEAAEMEKSFLGTTSGPLIEEVATDGENKPEEAKASMGANPQDMSEEDMKRCMIYWMENRPGDLKEIMVANEAAEETEEGAKRRKSAVKAMDQEDANVGT